MIKILIQRDMVINYAKIRKQLLDGPLIEFEKQRRTIYAITCFVKCSRFHFQSIKSVFRKLKVKIKSLKKV
jgi:uncharacterized protein YjhX (UPF0386 family)